MEMKQPSVGQSGKTKQPTIIDVDTKLRVVTPSLSAHRQNIPCPKIDSITIPTRRQSISRINDIITSDKQRSIRRTYSFSHVIVRNGSSQSQTVVSASTKLTHSEGIKPILKSGNSTYSLSCSDTWTHSEEQSSTLLDGKFCYRLPNKPTANVRKSVSFIEENLHDARKAHRKRLSSPVLQIQTGIHEHEDLKEEETI